MWIHIWTWQNWMYILDTFSFLANTVFTSQVSDFLNAWFILLSFLVCRNFLSVSLPSSIKCLLAAFLHMNSKYVKCFEAKCFYCRFWQSEKLSVDFGGEKKNRVYFYPIYSNESCKYWKILWKYSYVYSIICANILFLFAKQCQLYMPK